jgi:hypothetical protein
VVIHHADGESTVMVNQQKKAAEKDVLQPLGDFRFERGRAGWLEIRNEGSRGHVIVDAAQWLKQ